MDFTQHILKVNKWGLRGNHKVITLDNLKTFLDKLLEKIFANVYSKKEVDEKLSKMNTKSDGYSKAEIDEKLKNISKVNTSEFVKMKDGHIVLGEYEIWIER